MFLWALVAIVLALLPLSTALEIHHLFAAADEDGHQHSDTDLCQWVQSHTGHSLTVAPAAKVPLVSCSPHEVPVCVRPLSVRLIPVGPPRAPPA
jgi:hypothetical protein